MQTDTRAGRNRQNTRLDTEPDRIRERCPTDQRIARYNHCNADNNNLIKLNKIGAHMDFHPTRDTNTSHETKSTQDWFEPFCEDYDGSIPIVSMKIRERPFRALVDTGAGVNLIGDLVLEESIPEYRQYMSKTSTKAVDVNDQTLPLSGKIQCSIKLGTVIHDMKFEVMKHSDQLIIGNRFLHSNDLLVVARQGIGTKKGWTKNCHKKSSKTYAIKLEKDTTIEKGTCKPVKVMLSDNDRESRTYTNASFLTHSDGHTNNEISLEPTVTALSPDLTLIAMVSNLEGPQDLVLEKGTPVGWATNEFEDGEEMVAEIMAELSKIQESITDKRINHIASKDIVNGIQDLNDENTVIEPPGFETDGPREGEVTIQNQKKFGGYDVQRENQSSKLEDAIIHAKTPEVRKQIRKILKENESIFSEHNYDIGHFCVNGKVQKVKLHLTDTTPIIEKYRPLSPTKRAAAAEILEQLERSKIITRKVSGFASQCVWVTKSAPDLTPEKAAELGIEYVPGAKDETAKRNLRFCQDYRKLNTRLSSVQWPLPPIKSILARLRDMKCVSVLDASHSFYSIELDEESKLYTGFQCLERNYVMNRLAMGMATSSSILNACLAKTLQGLEYCTIPYSDNILVVSRDEYTHAKDLGKVLHALREGNWKFKAAKCHWAIKSTLKIFGMEVNLNEGTIKPDPSKCEALLKTPLPKDKKSLRSFLGSIGYFAECLPDMGGPLAELHDLTKGKESKITWSTEGEKAFKIILEALTDPNKIHMPSWDRPVHLVVDAGPKYTAAFLVQQSDNGGWVPLGFFTKKLSEREQRLSQIEKEALAVVYGLRQTSYYTAHTLVYIHSDNRPFVLLKKYSNINSKLSRWKLFVDSFDHRLVWESNSNGGISFADFMTRPPSSKILNRKITKEDIDSLPKSVPEGVYSPAEYDKLLEEILNKEEEEQRTEKIEHKIKSIKETNGEDTLANSIEQMIPWRGQSISKRTEIEMVHKIANIEQQIPKTKLGHPSRKTVNGNKPNTPQDALIEIVINECPFLNLKELARLQKECSVLGKIYKNPEHHPEFMIHEDILLKRTLHSGIERLLLAVPVSLADDLISDLHRGSAMTHNGQRKLRQMIQTRYFIPQLSRRVEKTVTHCGICSFYKPKVGLMAGRRPNATKMTARGPGDLWFMDHIQVTSKTDTEGNNALLCFVDAFSHYLVCKPIPPAITAERAASIFLEEVVSKFGVPRAIISDNGPDMDSTLWRETANLLSIKKVTIAAHSPRGNGVVEKVQGLVLAAIRNQAAQFRVPPSNWADLVTWSVLAHNATPFQDLQPPLSPAEIFLSRPISESSFFAFANASYAYRNLEEFNKKMVAAQMNIAEIIGAKERYLRELEEKKAILTAPKWEFPEGTLVAVKERHQATKNSHYKLRPKYRGVFIVVRQTTTACLIRPFSSETILNDMESPEEAHRGRGRALPRYKILKVDKQDLKKLKHLVFYSTPMAKKFMEHLVSAPPDLTRTYEVIPESDELLEEEVVAQPTVMPETSEETHMFKIKKSNEQKRSGSTILDEPPSKTLRRLGDKGSCFPFYMEPED